MSSIHFFLTYKFLNRNFHILNTLNHQAKHRTSGSVPFEGVSKPPCQLQKLFVAFPKLSPLSFSFQILISLHLLGTDARWGWQVEKCKSMKLFSESEVATGQGKYEKKMEKNRNESGFIFCCLFVAVQLVRWTSTSQSFPTNQHVTTAQMFFSVSASPFRLWTYQCVSGCMHGCMCAHGFSTTFSWAFSG